jgi:two-component system, OmpR family, copper resistance phosphate regulon response regulator CusR
MNRILIVEDESRLAAFVEKGLRRSGFDPTIAEDGEIALNLLAVGNFDLVLLDLGLPMIDGWMVLKQMRQQGQTMPAIVITAMSDNGDLERAISMGANAFVLKPFKFRELLDCIQRLLA